jgi:hypothetical protein
MSINININYKNPNHIKQIPNHIKQEGNQDNRGEPFKTKSMGVHNGKTCPHESHNDL